jgi:small neutral amino acid transporter SnatA (MarC family)
MLITSLLIQIDGRLKTAITVILVYTTILPILYLTPLVEKVIGGVGVEVVTGILYIYICAKGVSFVLSGLHINL